MKINVKVDSVKMRTKREERFFLLKKSEDTVRFSLGF